MPGVPMLTVSVAPFATLFTDFSAYNEGLYFLATQVNNLYSAGALTNSQYAGSGQPSGSTNYLTINSNVSNGAPTTPLQLGTGYSAVVVETDFSNRGVTTIQGGAAGETVLSGMAGIVYTSVTPTGPAATDYIVAGGGNNLVQVGPFNANGTATGTGNYFVATGDGNDSIAVFSGNATIQPGGGHNQVTLGGGFASGNNVVISNGYDSITGNSLLSGTGSGGGDTVAIAAGQTTINPGSSSFVVSDGSPNAISMFQGSGSDTVHIGGLGGGTVQGGTAGNNLLVGGIGGTASAPIVLQGGGAGDLLVAQGGGSVTLLGGAGNETLNAGLSVSRGNLLQAGRGNDTLVAGTGVDTLSAYGIGSAAVMLSGNGVGTVFQFVRGGGGGQDTIGGFKSTDTLAFYGYGASPLASASVAGGSTMFSLSDGTQITLAGVTTIPSGQVKAV